MENANTCISHYNIHDTTVPVFMTLNKTTSGTLAVSIIASLKPRLACMHV